MVEDRTLVAINTKVTSLLKHLPYRQLRVDTIEPVFTDDDSIHPIRISVVDRTKNERIDVVHILGSDESMDIKRCVEVLKSKIPAQYLSLNIVNVNQVAQEVLKNFSKRDLPDSFILEKLPYRQLQISVNGKRIFLKICVKSYQRVLSMLNSLTNWPNEVGLDRILNCLKRKELVTLLLYLSQID
jgi:hypothetical protein